MSQSPDSMQSLTDTDPSMGSANGSPGDPLTGSIQVWLARIDRPAAEIERRRHLLSSQERSRVDNYRNRESACRFIICRSLVRSILAERLGCAAHEVPIVYDRAGKPVLPPEYGWHFNLSHSADLALIGLTQVGPIGVDIEKVRHDFQIELIARRFFSPTEVRELLQVLPEERFLAFFRCWTRKEAFIKAIGMGLAFPLDEFDVTLLPHDAPAIRQIRGETREARRWQLLEIPTPVGYVGALAVRGAANERIVTIWGEEPNP